MRCRSYSLTKRGISTHRCCLIKQGKLLHAIVQNGYDGRELGGLVESGKFLGFLDNRFMVNLVEQYPVKFFDGNFWSDAFTELPAVTPGSAAEVRSLILSRYRNFLEDILWVPRIQDKDPGYTGFAPTRTLRLLTRRIANLTMGRGFLSTQPLLSGGWQYLERAIAGCYFMRLYGCPYRRTDGR